LSAVGTSIMPSRSSVSIAINRRHNHVDAADVVELSL
jgi:hypothetical protein